jgi:signal transduction histidine kinase
MPASQVLVVEDEGVIALHLRQRLLNLGYDVPEPVATGDRALRVIEESRPDVILMDIKIAGSMDGIATATHIPPEYQIPVIYLTAYSEAATLERASATKPYGYLLKPFSERELHAMIQVTLARRRAEQAMQAAEETRRQARKMEALGQLAGGVAHDFNALLAVVYRNLEEMGNYTVSHPKMAELVRDVFAAATKREKLAEQLLAFSRRQPLTPRAISINDFVSDLIDEFGRTLGDQVRIESFLPEELWKTLIDASQLDTALSNLAMNALDAMPNGGTLTFSAQNIALDQDNAEPRSGRYVLLTVSDTGTGMPASVIERAFEPFFTTKASATSSDVTTFSGTGLGLSQVFGFVEQSGGHISIDSELGCGTTIRIYLPTVSDGDEKPPSGMRRQIIDHDDLTQPMHQTASAWHELAIHRKNIISQTHEALWRKHNVYNFRRNMSGTAQGEPVLHVPWQRAENSLFAAVASSQSGVRYHLIIEELPRRNGWDWAVWRPGGTREAARHGRASAVLIAMAAAEDAARAWDEVEQPDRG